jgi:hypothetical protein
LAADTLAVALRYAQEICKRQADPVAEVILFAPAKHHVKHTGLATALGESLSRSLHDGHSVLLPFGIPMRLETIKTLRWLTKRSVVICAYADQKMLDQIDSDTKLAGVVAIPHAPGVLDQWQKTWSAHVHGQAPQPIDLPLIADPVIEQALISLNQQHQSLSSASSST